MKAREWLSALTLLATTVLGALLFSQLPIESTYQAFDWKIFWEATHQLRVDYRSEVVFNPPWVLALLWPISLWPLKFSFGLAAMATTTLLVASVPRAANRRRWLAALLGLIFSYPAIRHLLEGNLEGIMIAGALLLVWALERRSAPALGISALLLCAKVQEAWLLFILLALYLWRHWPWRSWLQAAAWATVIALPFLVWRGQAWWQAATEVGFTRTNSSLLSVAGEVGAPSWLVWLLWLSILGATLWVLGRREAELASRPALGALLAGGLLLSPYASNLSILTPLAIGLIPYIQRRGWCGAGLMMFFFLPYVLFLSIDFRLQWENPYWTIGLLLIWGLLLRDAYQEQSQRGTKLTTVPPG